jgi:hypothetical protein
MTAERHRKIMRILGSVLECERSGRRARLGELCAGDPALRREVESLLAFEGLEIEILERPIYRLGRRRKP